MKTFSYLLFTILFIFSSCKKEDTGKIVLAGIYNTDLFFYEFSPPLKVELSLDTLTNNYSGEDSIDINQDDLFDLIISHRIHIPPESGTPSYDHFPFYKLTLKNGLQVATKVQSYPTGHGQSSDVNWVDTLNYEARIDKSCDWSESNIFRLMWAIPPVVTAPYGPWYNLTNEEKYIGIRMQIDSRPKYGWIKVKVISRDDMQFLNYALKK